MKWLFYQLKIKLTSLNFRKLINKNWGRKIMQMIIQHMDRLLQLKPSIQMLTSYQIENFQNVNKL